MLPFVGPFLYKCNDCGKVLEKPEKIHIIIIDYIINISRCFYE